MTILNSIINSSMSETSVPARQQSYVALSNGDNEVIAAQENKQIQITGIVLTSDVAGIFVLESNNIPIATFVLSSTGGYSNYVVGKDGVLFAGGSGKDMSITVSSSPTTSGVYLQYRYK